MIEKKKTARVILWIVFLTYCAALAYILAFNRPMNFNVSFGAYISEHSNFIPFKVIFHYSSIAKKFPMLFVMNILGNFVIFMPFAVFLPCIFRKVDRFWKVTVITCVTVATVECTQLLLRVGTIDVDDFILNVSGAMLGYVILKIPVIARLLRKWSLLPEKEEIKSEKRENGKATLNQNEERLESLK